MAKISGSEDLLASIYRHDVVNPLNVLSSSLEDEEYDVLGVWELDEKERYEVEGVASTLQTVYEELDDDEPLETVDDEVRELAGYSGVSPVK